MKRKKNRQFFLVLVPHRDTRGALKKYQDSLEKEGLTGCYPFPLVAPLAALEKPFKEDELKQIARSLRESLGGEKFAIRQNVSVEFVIGEDELVLWGLSLGNGEWGMGNGESKIKNLFSPTVIGTWLEPKNLEQQLRVLRVFASRREAMPPCDVLAFNSAAVTNMSLQKIKINGETIYKYKIGKLSWLPKQLIQPRAKRGQIRYQ